MNNNSSLISPKTSYLVILFVQAGLLAFGYYLEFFQDIEPCPLCMTQRLCLYVISLLAFIALTRVKHRGWSRAFFIPIAFIAFLGASVASRQIWLQHLPKDLVPACGPDLSYIIQEFPMHEVITAMFTGDGNCAETVWTFLGLSIPTWSLICFLLTGFFCIYQRIKIH